MQSEQNNNGRVENSEITEVERIVNRLIRAAMNAAGCSMCAEY